MFEDFCSWMVEHALKTKHNPSHLLGMNLKDVPKILACQEELETVSCGGVLREEKSLKCFT